VVVEAFPFRTRDLHEHVLIEDDTTGCIRRLDPSRRASPTREYTARCKNAHRQDGGEGHAGGGVALEVSAISSLKSVRAAVRQAPRGLCRYTRGGSLGSSTHVDARDAVSRSRWGCGGGMAGSRVVTQADTVRAILIGAEVSRSYTPALAPLCDPQSVSILGMRWQDGRPRLIDPRAPGFD
jgi:hypothetical protein